MLAGIMENEVTNAQRAAIKAAAYLDIAAQAIQRAHRDLSDSAVTPELGTAGKRIVERIRELRNDANALAIDVLLVGYP